MRNFKSRKIKRYLFAYLMLLPAFIFFVLFVIYPSFDAISLSFHSWKGYGERAFVGLKNYMNLAKDPIFWASLKNNLIFVVATTILQTVIPMILATLLAKNNFVNGFFRVGFFIPNIISFIITGSLWATIFEPNFGLLNTLLYRFGLGNLAQLWLASPKWALACIIFVSLWQSMGFYLIIFFAGLQRIPRNLYEVASVDGASRFEKFIHITVPLLKPVTTVVVIINIIGGFKVFDIVWAMTTGGPNHASEVMATYLYTTAFGNIGTGTPSMGYGASIGIVILLLSVISSIINLKIGEAKRIDY
ncbi:MAG: carbohydrate ABC transporter permease [bacterium]